MQKILSLLLTIVFLQSQAFALSGGPQYPVNAQSVLGIYAGVMVPEDIEALGIDPLLSQSRENALGIFSYSIPETGLGSGSFILFAEGQISFLGTIDVLGDPKGGKFYGILDTTFGITTSVTTSGTDGGSVTTALLTGHAAGRLNAEIQNGVTTDQVTRIEGDAFLTFDLGNDPVSGEIIVTNIINFVVDGYKQSSFASTGA